MIDFTIAPGTEELNAITRERIRDKPQFPPFFIKKRLFFVLIFYKKFRRRLGIQKNIIICKCKFRESLGRKFQKLTFLFSFKTRFSPEIWVVPAEGLEPPRPIGQQILSL